jgi:ketosteroid isomerase-like protein
VKHVFWMLLLCPLANAAPCPANQAKDRDALKQIEQSWAQALNRRDEATLECILAEEFEDADIEGKTSDRATTLARVATSHSTDHTLSDLRAYVHGDFGYIRGLASGRNPETKMVSKVLFTDIYVYRDQRWQCVAGQESLVYSMSH